MDSDRASRSLLRPYTLQWNRYTVKNIMFYIHVVDSIADVKIFWTSTNVQPINNDDGETVVKTVHLYIYQSDEAWTKIFKPILHSIKNRDLIHLYTHMHEVFFALEKSYRHLEEKKNRFSFKLESIFQHDMNGISHRIAIIKYIQTIFN